MERRTFGVQKVSIKRRQQKPRYLNNELWKHQVSLPRVKIDSDLTDKYHRSFSRMLCAGWPIWRN